MYAASLPAQRSSFVRLGREVVKSRMQMRSLIVTVAVSATVVALAACLDPVSSALPPTPVGAPCVPSQSVSGGPSTDPNGPYFQQVVIGTSANGRTVTGATQVLDHASVPDGVQLATGTVLVYYLNGEDGALWVARYEANGARVVSPVYVNGIRAPLGVGDPDVQQLPNGDVRMAYVGGVGAATESNPRGICIADSDDGTHFDVRSVAYSVTDSTPVISGPSLARLDESNWMMAFSLGQRTTIATSNDGYHFLPDTILNGGNTPELAIVDASTVRLYTCGQGISSRVTTTRGRTWTTEGVVVAAPFNGKTVVCDPSFVPSAALMIFKTGG